MVGFASLYLPYSPALPRRRQAHLQVIKTADWVIDLGREGGDESSLGDRSEDIVKAPRSYTGKFLAPVLKKADGKPRKSAGASEAAE